MTVEKETPVTIFQTDRPNKLECYTTLGWNGLPGTKTLAYCTHLVSYEENEVLCSICSI
jgi:hypothetical protein